MADAIINVNGDQVQSLEIILFMGLLSILPSMVIMMTCFTRFIISLSFLRTAMGTQQTPPNTVLVGMALVLTLFTMTPTLDSIRVDAYDPYVAGEISQEEFFDRAQDPLKSFMLDNTEISSLELYCEISGTEPPPNLSDAGEMSMLVIVPAFVTTELKEAFEIGFLLYIPFMLIDIIVSSTLMSMGMIMLPPSMISTPFKILLFILLDGWQLLFSALVRGIN